MVRNALEEAAGELREIEQARMTLEQTIQPLREAIGQVRLKEQEARITENQFAEQLKESGVNERELIDTLGKTKPSPSSRNCPANFRNRWVGGGESGSA